jgi:hypothetical protein
MGTRQFVFIIYTMAIGLLVLTFAPAHWPAATAHAAAIDPIAHDPTMIKQGQYYYVFITGDAGRPNTYLPIKRSTDLLHWEELGPVFSAPPQWIVDTLGSRHAISGRRTSTTSTADTTSTTRHPSSASTTR